MSFKEASYHATCAAEITVLKSRLAALEDAARKVIAEYTAEFGPWPWANNHNGPMDGLEQALAALDLAVKGERGHEVTAEERENGRPPFSELTITRDDEWFAGLLRECGRHGKDCDGADSLYFRWDGGKPGLLVRIGYDSSRRDYSAREFYAAWVFDWEAA